MRWDEVGGHRVSVCSGVPGQIVTLKTAPQREGEGDRQGEEGDHPVHTEAQHGHLALRIERPIDSHGAAGRQRPLGRIEELGRRSRRSTRSGERRTVRGVTRTVLVSGGRRRSQGPARSRRPARRRRRQASCDSPESTPLRVSTRRPAGAVERDTRPRAARAPPRQSTSSSARCPGAQPVVAVVELELRHHEHERRQDEDHRPQGKPEVASGCGAGSRPGRAGSRAGRR